MSSAGPGNLIRVQSIGSKGKKISISFSNGETLLCGPDSYSEFRLYEGKEINSLEFKKIKDYIQMEDLYAYALNLISLRMRSKKEVRDKLSDNPQYGELIKKYQARIAGQSRPLTNTIKKLQTEGLEVPDILKQQYEYFKK